MTGIPSIQAADAYVAYVRKVTSGDPGRRAALRRSLGRPVTDITARGAHAVVAAWLPEAHEVPGAEPYAAVESAYYTVAALVAAHPASQDQAESPSPEAETAAREGVREQVSLGRTLGLAAADGVVNPATAEARLHLLCRQDVAGLHRHLPGLFRLLHAKNVQVDLARLLIDLCRWGRWRDQVAKEWLQDFYRAGDRARNDDRKAAAADGREGEDE
ncbi:type I-E CRISPR-associated protein Cse2/CasB [Thermobispora bispora]|uniref:type I-E CRISPR-associated protein Cse2/CasB n=1 Tax=Thermobispora bispora TaxID=2006 RepID=UPI00197F206D|nr:type I-E CRISPR-associated protein Cse2/CasB [Thermobispora bispora]QSI48079.1 type I-E CRISPR-associated protein Cse2/CasB [Thermobispora bispora]